MKRVLLFSVMVGLFAGQASADLWEVDRPTALGWTSTVMNIGTTAGDFSVYDGPPPGTLVFGPGAGGSPIYGSLMSGQVGFAATIAADDTADGVPGNGIGYAEIEIYDATPGLTGTTLYDGISMYVQNDNQSHWEYQLFYVAGGTEYNSGLFVHLSGLGGDTVLTTGAPIGGLDLDDITKIGLRIHGHNMGGSDPTEPSFSDTFHTSVVPVPGAVLLGLLGLTVAGLKLRKSA